MKCRYCSNEVEPNSRLAHLETCSSCSALDLLGNLLQELQAATQGLLDVIKRDLTGKSLPMSIIEARMNAAIKALAKSGIR